MEDTEDRLLTVLDTNLCDVGKLLRDKMGLRYYGLTELELLVEVFKITTAETMQHPKQDTVAHSKQEDAKYDEMSDAVVTEVPTSKSAVEEDAAAPGGNIGHHGAGADQGSPQAVVN